MVHTADPILRIAVIGREGQLARSLAEIAVDWSDIEIICLGRPEFDLIASDDFRSAMVSVKADLVINTAAYTAVDKAETDAINAFRINRDGAGNLAKACAALALPFIHISTDYVFDGERKQPYLETDGCDPQSVYGRSKYEGELAVLRQHPAAVIVRTAWVHSPFGANFVKTILRLSGERDALRVVSDQCGSPTYAPDLAAALLVMARRRIAAPVDGHLGGIFHLVGSGQATWHEVAVAVMAEAAALGHRAVPVAAITTADYPTPAKRPAWSVLDTAKVASRYGVKLPPWRESLQRCVKRLLA